MRWGHAAATDAIRQMAALLRQPHWMGTKPGIVDDLVSLPALLMDRGQLGEVSVECADSSDDRGIRVTAIVARQVVSEADVIHDDLVVI